MKVNPPNKISAHNLPAPVSTFVGREREFSEVKQLISAHRLVTLAGAGGSGKTRLSLQVAGDLLNEFEHGVWFVELASIFDPGLIPQAVASALHIREQSGQPLIEVLVKHLAAQKALLLLDSCEHLVSACAEFVETTLQKCPDLKILATSREVLGITGEVAWTVPPLSLPAQQPWKNPASGQEAVRYYEGFESVQLFVDRAKAVYQAFRLTAENGPWVAEICRRLDGMPLAIELAAARVRDLSIRQVAQRLDERFQLLTTGSRTAPLRQQTLLSTLDWSYTLLPKKEQRVLQRLSVFAGSVTLQAAETVCTRAGVEPAEVVDALFRLVSKSLVISEKPEPGVARYESRYRLLETIRQYALEKLEESGEMAEAKDRHLDYFIHWAESAEPHLTGSEQLPSLELYEEEHDNLRAALAWCRRSNLRVEAELQLVVACGLFWRLRGYLSEGRSQISAALAGAASLQKTEVYARALYWSASLAYLQSDYPITRRLGEESLRLWHELSAQNKSHLADTFDLLGQLATEEGDYETAPILLTQALDIFRELEDANGVADMLMQLGWAYMRMGDYEKVAPHMEEALAIHRQIGNASRMGFILGGLGELAVRQGQYERAMGLLEESLAIRRQHGHKWGVGTALGSLGWVALRQHRYQAMRELLDESLSIRRDIDDRGGIAWCLEKLAEAKYEQALVADSVRIFGQADALRGPIQSVIDPADQTEYDRIISGLQSALGEDEFEALWAEGAAMPLEQIIDLAVSEAEPLAAALATEKEKFGGLTAREREVAALIAQGKSNREIADEMTVGVKTIETYVTRILNKLGFNSRVQIATWAVEKGLK